MTGTEQSLVNRLVTTIRQGRDVTLVLGSGLTARVVPGVERMVDLADEFVAQALQNSDLQAALAELRATRRDAALYTAYRRAFTEWLSPVEFDIVVQRATLEAYRPARVAVGWERVGYHRGVQLEEDRDAWSLPPGVVALGELLAGLPDRFQRRVVTTNFDPLIEIAVRRAGGTARSLTLRRDGTFTGPLGPADGIDVLHLHGYWRPTSETDERSLLHDPEPLRADDTALVAALAEALRGDTLCVAGYPPGRNDALTRAVQEQSDVLWARHDEDASPVGAALIYTGVDVDRLFPAVRRGLATLPAPPGPETQAPPRPVEQPVAPAGTALHRVHLPTLEAVLGTRPSAVELLRQLDYEFRWRRVDDTPDTPLDLVFWPVRLRQPTLIYAVQATVAAALSARGVRVVLCFDDLAGDQHTRSWRVRFTDEVERWFALVEGARPPEVDSLMSFCSPGRVAERLQDPELLRRPTHPWAVQLEYYRGDRMILDVARGAKAFPGVGDLDIDDAMVGAQIRTTRAERLMSTPAIWAYLQYLLRDTRPEAVMTLGGEDEAVMWDQWHDTFPDSVGHLFHPVMANVRQDARMLGARSFREVEDHLRKAMRLASWDREDHYLHWIVQHAVVLHRYLRNRPPLSYDGRLLDSWETIRAALLDARLRPGTLRVIAREVAALLMHESV
ncbi:hypothetical protein Daura_16135 [Dactylosporangium aurantiacum]|uniref:SIR2-like domain-containing protein n=1 Tax=Dactylosporangium aurantiacum TaxID=35754 RepID=A0A9Q9IPL0_9ACTN|nr:hypothetical protein [Dactylosporangium aurantiacum]MDG6103035.1 hypothetical protein [Dactylosporangium aurantiacum]UWZ57547.1 hypothetical protein Daura_16135 [Dactylosporangium aurantiacum]